MKCFEASPSFLLLLLLIVLTGHEGEGFSTSNTESPSSRAASGSGELSDNNVLILDHLNINHEKGRHDWLKAFYVDFLQCALDPRKIENVASGKKTLWCNIGANQFHLPEGKPAAQVLDGVITLVYPDISKLMERLEAAKSSLEGSKFEVKSASGDGVLIMDPWGSVFNFLGGDASADLDSRGRQPGETSEGLAMRDLKIHVPVKSNLAGIGRFYERVLGAHVKDANEDSVTIQVGPSQTLTFQENSQTTIESHVDLRDEAADESEGRPMYLSNYGPHVSMYVKDLPSSYKRADALNLAYVNPRFKRRAYTLEEAVDDCMFRCLDIVDPDQVQNGPIIKLEHEVRSVVKRDGSKYKSCPFDEIPAGCTTL
mmetsp:Transcript_44217/g.106550  ORF Transcript_44217/g.106550 Transcript_44217/m.106550 type:complete len:370 (-) Transcript_44217:1926-3035(-)